MRNLCLFYSVFAFINCNILANSEDGNIVGLKRGSMLNASRRPLANITNGSRLRQGLKPNNAKALRQGLKPNITNGSRLRQGLKTNKATDFVSNPSSGVANPVSEQAQDKNAVLKSDLRDCLAALRLVVKGSEKKVSFEPYQAFYENAYARYGDALKIPHSQRSESAVFKEKLILAFESLKESFGCLERKGLSPEPKMVYLHENLKELSDSVTTPKAPEAPVTKINRTVRRRVVSFQK